MSDRKNIERDFNFEPQPGLPAPLPQGEDLLWQGSPDARLLARQLDFISSLEHCLSN